MVSIVGFEPVARDCLSKMADHGLVHTICRPERELVRSQHLVADYDISVFIETKLKFCVCNDNAFA